MLSGVIFFSLFVTSKSNYFAETLLKSATDIISLIHNENNLNKDTHDKDPCLRTHQMRTLITQSSTGMVLSCWVLLRMRIWTREMRLPTRIDIALDFKDLIAEMRMIRIRI